MPEMHRTTLGNVQVRDVEGSPGRFEGVALPYETVIDVSYGREKFVRGAFAAMAREINAGNRIAFLNRHGEDGGVPVGVISHLQERDDGLHFAGDFLDSPETPSSRSQISSGINGVSVEFVPGKFRRKGNVVEHYADVRLAAIAGSYAPAYRQANIALRSVNKTREGNSQMPALSSVALNERRDTIDRQVATIRHLAETEDRGLDDDETREIETLTTRRSNVTALIAEADIEAQRRSAERNSLPVRATGETAVITRSESIYGPRSTNSYFTDLIAAYHRDSAAMDRMSRHRALVGDLVNQMETRAVDSADIAAAYPTNYFPDLYVGDIAMGGPFSDFFPTTPITAPNPIVLPMWDQTKLTGDTGIQPAENAPLPIIEMGTKPLTLTPKTIGGEVWVSRQAVDGASPGTDVIIGNQLRELLMRDTEREIALVLESLAPSGAIPDTAGTTPGAAGADLHAGIASILGKFYAGDSAGGVNARFLPAEAVFVNATDWGNLIAGTDTMGRPLLAYVAPVNSLGSVTGAGFQAASIGGTPVIPAWSILDPTNQIVARRNDARQWKSATLDIRLMEREGPETIVFVVWQYFGFAVLQPKGVRRYTYTNV